MTIYTVRARNLATASTNKIHDDEVARSYGFAGGLVPGVEVYAYMTHPLVERWGIEWLRAGRINARFQRPVYDGAPVRVTAEFDRTVALALHDEHGIECARGTGWAPDPSTAPDVAAYPAAPLPDPVPVASPESLEREGPLGSVEKRFDQARADEYLDAIHETLPLYREGVAHPGWLLRRANRLLASNVRLGPWIHVESTVTNYGAVRDGDLVSTRGHVTRVWEAGGHKFVALDVLLVIDNAAVTHVGHVAIYEPRRRDQPSKSSDNDSSSSRTS